MSADVPKEPTPLPLGRAGQSLLDLIGVMWKLRQPGGCPWDAEQTHQSLARHLLEETHEFLDAIDEGDDPHIREELGDLLIQVVFHAQIAAEEGRWDLDDVAEALKEKLVYRHPHVFGDVSVSGSDEVLANWEKLKAAEKAEKGETGGVEEGIPQALPALARAAKVQRRAASTGFEFKDAEGALTKLREELEELAQARTAPDADPTDIEAEFGDVLFAMVAVSRQLGVDAETALRRTTRTFAERYDRMVQEARDEGTDLSTLSDQELLALFRAAR